MNRLFLSFCAGVLFLNACSGWGEGGREAPLRELVEAELTLNSVSLTEEGFRFSFFISRPGLGLSELNYPEDAYEEDLPLALQTESIYLSGIEDTELKSGSSCHFRYFPHPCEFEVDDYTQPYLVKIKYADGDYSMTQVEVPVPEALATPTIVSPVKTPEQNSTFEIQFKDVGADSYDVYVANCGEYPNNGVSPCLDDDTVTVTMESGEPEILVYDYEDADPYRPSVSMKEGVITLKSEFKMNFTVNVSYWIQAHKSFVNEGVDTYTESEASLWLSL